MITVCRLHGNAILESKKVFYRIFFLNLARNVLVLFLALYPKSPVLLQFSLSENLQHIQRRLKVTARLTKEPGKMKWDLLAVSFAVGQLYLPLLPFLVLSSNAPESTLIVINLLTDLVIEL